jgi:TorA maturation chaperone TorD
MLQDVRARVYLIAALLFEQPRPGPVEVLRALLVSLLYGAPSQAPWLATLATLAQRLVGRDEALVAEHTRLFVLAIPEVPAPPFASHWLEPNRRSSGEVAQTVADAMAEHGLRPDHIVSELEFMAFLAKRGAETLATQEWLLEQHLARWTPAFIEALRDGMPAERYRLAADLLEQLVAWDLGNITGREVERKTARALIPPTPGLPRRA